MSKKRYGKRRQQRSFSWVIIIGFLLIGLWLVLSIVKGMNPLDVFAGKLSTDPTQEEVRISYDSLQVLYNTEKTKASNLSDEIMEFKSSAQSRVVTISGGTLNMRSASSTSADVIEGIPTGTAIKLYYCKSDSTVIEGNKGVWCKISHQNSEGWVWSEYLK